MSSLSQTQLSEREPERPDLSDPEITEIPRARIPDGLVPADQLPSAAEVLAQLFPPGEQLAIDFSDRFPATQSSEAPESRVAQTSEADASAISYFGKETTEFHLDTEVSVKADLQEQADVAEPPPSEDVPANGSPALENGQEGAEPVRISKRTRDAKAAKNSSFAGIVASARNLVRGFLTFAGSSRGTGAQASSQENVSATPETLATAEGASLAEIPAGTTIPPNAADAAHTSASATPDLLEARSHAAEKQSDGLPHESSAEAGLTVSDNGNASVLSRPREPFGEVSKESAEFFSSSEWDFSRAAADDLRLQPQSAGEVSLGSNSDPQSPARSTEEDDRAANAFSIEDFSAHEIDSTDAQTHPLPADAIQPNAAGPDREAFSASRADEHFDSPQDEVAEEELEAVDTTDDDKAIASAIERYANLTDPGRANSPENREASTQGKHDSAEQVDINVALDISRDIEPGDSVLGYIVPSIQIQNIEELSGLSVPSVLLNQEQSATQNPPETIPSQGPTDKPFPTAIPYRDWSFEEKLASHHEWIESKGKTGKKADFSAADLEGTELIGVNLRFVDLHDVTLRAADLLMADLRDACLVRTNFRDTCLVGANLEAANLEGASLETAMGLVPRQLAGANLHEATLPPHILAFEALSEFRRASGTVYGFFVGIMSLSVLSWLIVWMTKDFQLLTNAALLPFLHSPAAAAALPTQQFYLIAPFALFIVYLVFHFHLQHLWDLVLELPAVFPDGRALGENEPRIVVGLLRTHFRWMNQDAPSTRIIEKGISVFVAYWIVPLTLLLYWLRFLTLQNVHGTVLQELLVVGATGAALYSTSKVGRPAETWTLQENVVERLVGKYKSINPVTAALIVLGVLTFLSAGTMTGVPHGQERAPQFRAGSIRRWAPSVLWSFGINPYADLTESVISSKPGNWNGSDEQVSSVKGARLNDLNFRYAQAYRVFLANAHLLHANFQGAFLSQADLRGADLGQSNLRYAILDQALLNHADLDRAVLDGANLSRADARAANLSYASLAGALLGDARLDGATLYGAKLPSATLIRANFEKADLRESHLEGANLEHADLQGAYLWSSKLAGAHLNNAQLGAAIFVDANLRGADLRWAQLAGTVLTGADLTGALLDGADFRGAVGFGSNQICSAKSRQGLLLADAMQAQVTAQCGLAQ